MLNTKTIINKYEEMLFLIIEKLILGIYMKGF